MQINMGDEIRIVPLTKIPELLPSAKIIAASFKAILKFHIRANAGKDKIESVKDYFSKNGWKVES